MKIWYYKNFAQNLELEAKVPSPFPSRWKTGSRVESSQRRDLTMPERRRPSITVMARILGCLVRNGLYRRTGPGRVTGNVRNVRNVWKIPIHVDRVSDPLLLRLAGLRAANSPAYFVSGELT